MMNTEDSIIFSLSDIWLLLKRYHRTIFVVTLLFTAMTGFFILKRPIVYEVEATFKEKERSGGGGGGGSLSALIGFGSFGRQDNEALSLMQSRSLMEPIVKEMGLQAAIAGKGQGSSLLQTMRDNLRVQAGHFFKKQHPVLSDCESELACGDITYARETPLNFQVSFSNEETYSVKDKRGEEWGKSGGKLGELYRHGDISFTLTSLNQTSLKGKTFWITLYPLHIIATSFADALEVNADDDDTNLLKLEFRHPDRHFAAQFLNNVMAHYQKYLQDRNDYRAQIQLNYLEQRQGETDEALHHLLSKHADSLSTDVFQSGFTDSTAEMEFFAINQQANKAKLMEIDLALKKIEQTKDNEDGYRDHGFLGNEQPAVLQAIVQMRTLTQQRDRLELELQKIQKQLQDDLSDGFETHVAELKDIQELLREIQVLRKSMEAGSPLPRDLNLFSNPHLLVGEWIKRIEHVDYCENEKFTDTFLAYLNNLHRIYTVQAHLIEQRLAHQQNPRLEFEGIDLETTETLYVHYQKELDGVQAAARQNAYILEQFDHHTFDITSLSISLDDFVSQKMIEESVSLTLQLLDEQNRSDKEQKRLQDSLDLYRDFLTSHLRQQMEVLKLKEKLLNEKNIALQQTMLDLIHQQISILERHIDDYIAITEDNLKHEKRLLEEDLVDLRKQMSKLPQRWVSEKLIDMHMLLSQHTVEEVSKLVESKNIAHHLEIIESSPIDIAIVPILPKSPRLPLFLIIGASLGAFLASVLIILRAIVSGIPVSRANLLLSGQHVSGVLVADDDDDNHLETLRQVMAFLPKVNMTEQSSCLVSVAIGQGRGCDFSPQLATLLTKRGDRVLIVNCSFRRSTETQPGLLQLLEGEATEPTIITREGYDYIDAGGETRYSAELLASQRFCLLLDEFKAKYNYILLVTDVPSCSAEAVGLAQLSDAAVVAVSDEQLQDLSPYTHNEAVQRVSFVIASANSSTPS